MGLWEASRGPLGGIFEAFSGLFGGFFLGLFGASWGPLRASWSLLGPSWGPLGASWGPLGAEGSIFRFVVPLLGPSYSCFLIRALHFHAQFEAFGSDLDIPQTESPHSTLGVLPHVAPKLRQAGQGFDIPPTKIS